MGLLVLIRNQGSLAVQNCAFRIIRVITAVHLLFPLEVAYGGKILQNSSFQSGQTDNCTFMIYM